MMQNLKYILVNLERDGLPMVSLYSTEEAARKMMQPQNESGGAGTFTLLCEVKDAIAFGAYAPFDGHVHSADDEAKP